MGGGGNFLKILKKCFLFWKYFVFLPSHFYYTYYGEGNNSRISHWGAHLH